MGLSRLNVWVRALNDPMRTFERPSFVHVLHHDGTVLDWCGRRYTDLPAKCGHLELEVPPGCYAVCASMDTNGSDDDLFLGNHLSHIGLVNVECGEHACVELFLPTMSYCFTWFESALRQAVEAGRLDAGDLDEVLGRFRERIPTDPFTDNMRPLVESQPWRTG